MVADPPPTRLIPALRSGFLTFTEARTILAENPGWAEGVKGDLQTHTLWSDGTASILEMATAAIQLGYEYIATTDHAKGLKIARGIDETQLRPGRLKNCRDMDGDRVSSRIWVSHVRLERIFRGAADYDSYASETLLLPVTIAIRSSCEPGRTSFRLS